MKIVAWQLLSKRLMPKRRVVPFESSHIGDEILAYLAEHPDSCDTAEGIIQWWLLERKIECQTTKVREALTDLVARGLVLEHRGGNSRILYRLNQHKQGEIQSLLKQRLDDRFLE